MAPRPHVALLIESTSAYGRGLLAGIAAYVREQEPWTIHWQERSLEDAPPSWLRGWKGHGIIARIATARFARALRATGLPVVNLYRWLANLQLPGIYPDNAALTRLAAEHLLQRGFRHFAYCGFAASGYSDERAQMFARWIDNAGHPCHVYQPPRGRRLSQLVVPQQSPLHEAHVTRWLRQLPKPLGLLACNDVCGQQLLTICRDIGLRVPEDAAILGVDNNELLCKLADPPLSSVDPNSERIGYEAAALLVRLMSGQAAPAASILIEPRGIVTRRSTDVLAIEDANLAEALRFIRGHAPESLTVHDVLKSCSL